MLTPPCNMNVCVCVCVCVCLCVYMCMCVYKKPNILGSWGLNNIFLFSKELAAKVGWRLISTHGIGTEVVTHKFITLESLEHWIRNIRKRRKIASFIWKAIINYFHLIEECLSGRIGRGTKVQLGAYPWTGCQNKHILPQHVI